VRAPDITYRYLGAIDVSGVTLETIHRQADTSTAVASVTHTLIPAIPKDRALILSNIAIESIPGAAQTLTDVAVLITGPTGIAVNVARFAGAAAAAAREAFNWSGEVYVLGAGTGFTTLTVTAFWNAGVAANRLITSCSGLVIPRANIGNF